MSSEKVSIGAVHHFLDYPMNSLDILSVPVYLVSAVLVQYIPALYRAVSVMYTVPDALHVVHLSTAPRNWV